MDSKIDALENEIWVFLSHSNKDYEKVIKVRNLLEANSFRPLMFFLKCLNDDDEIDDLIKREIDSRGRFILCDSENARNSNWVQREIKYIKEKQRIYQTINIDDSEECIAKEILGFKKRSTVFISYAANDREYCLQLGNILRSDWDFSVNEYEQNMAGTVYVDTIKKGIDYALNNGYVIFIITENFLKSNYCISELEYTLNKVKQYPKLYNIIVMVNEGLSFESIKKRISGLDSLLVFRFNIMDGRISFDKIYLYWTFMRKYIQDEANNGDPNALYVIAEHYFSYDDRFDLPGMEGMRVYAAETAKKAADKGHKEAKFLYDLIISDYPELKERIEKNKYG